MKILVTGREGQLAQSIVERAAGHPELEIVTTSRPEADLSSSGSVAAAIAAARPDLIINAAAYTAVDQAEDEPALAFRINGEAAGEAAAAARELGAVIIQLSTDYVFDGLAEGPYDEDAPTDPLSVYGRSKLAGEQAVREANPQHLILRTAWVYSPFGRNFVRTMMAAARERAEIKVVADQLGNPTSALDLADAILAIAVDSRVAAGRTYHLAGTGSTSWCGFAEAVMKACAMRGLPAATVRPIRTRDWPTRAVRPANSMLECARFERDFGFRLPDWRQSLEAVIDRLAEQEG